MQNDKAKFKKRANYKNYKNLGFFIFIFIFSLFIFNLKDAEATFTISRPSTNNLGLVGHWTFDGKNVVNGVALDSTANGNNGNLVNIATSTFYAAGKIGQGFNFDGTDDYISIPRINNNEMSVSAWFYHNVDDAVNADAIWGGWYWTNNPSNREGFDLSFTTGVGNVFQLVLETIGATTTENISIYTMTPSTGAWHHGVATYDSASGNQKLYVDGVLRDTDFHPVGATIKPLTQYADMRIGHSRVNAGYFNGSIDDVRVYNRALSANEIKNLYNQGSSKFNKTPTNILTNGLVGHWTFDGGKVVNGVALDSSGNGNNGNLINIATSTFYSTGKIGQGFKFDGTDDYITIPYNASLKLGNTGSVSLWVKPLVTSPSQTRNLISYGGISYASGYLLSQYDTSLRVYWMNSVQIFSVSNAFTANTWSHIVLTNDNGALIAYVNGVQSGSGTSGGTIVNNYTTLIGGVPTNWRVNGNIDDVRVYNRALTAGDVAQLYNMGR